MKQKKINLSLYTDDYKRTQRLFKIVRIFTFVISILVTFSFTVFFLANSRLVKQIEELDLEKNQLLTGLQKNKKNEATLVFLTKKLDLTNQYLDTDTKFISYYNLILSNVNVGTGAATLDSFEIDNSRASNFKVVFKNRSDMLNYLKFAESDGFLRNFEFLTLTNINLNPQGSAENPDSPTYQLSFSGKFSQINESRN